MTAQTNVDTNVTQNNVDATLTQQKPQDQAQPVINNAVVETEQKEDPNWKAFREARKQDRIQREQAEKMAADSSALAKAKQAEAEALKAAMEAILNKPQQNQYSNYQQEETEDQRIDKKVNEAIEKQKAEYQRQELEREQKEYPQRLQKNFSDFNQTVAQENLDYLDYHYPEVSHALQLAPEGYAKWEAIYKNVKKFVPNTNHKKDQAKADKNFNMPKSISSTNVTPQGAGIGAIRLDEARKAANWERMQRQLKGV